MKSKKIASAFGEAVERYGEQGVDVEGALEKLMGVAVSLHCWQGDDVRGFENADGAVGDGLAVTGNHPGRARTPGELRRDLEEALRMIPGKHRLNLHAFYAETGGRRVERDVLGVEHFGNWIGWAQGLGIGIDLNPTYFSHPKVVNGLTLSSPDVGVRRYWIEHGVRCREIGEAMGKALGGSCLTNFWVPDGMKDTPVDRRGPRERLAESLDEIFEANVGREYNVDSVEPKLFGIGAESYTAGSHDFYLGYAVSRKTLLTLDAGHYHPTECISDKISSILTFLPEIALHVSRGVRWDSDHVVTLTDELEAIAQEIVWGGYLGRTRIGLDYFDASINRVAAWVIGTRNLLKAILLALVAPVERLRRAESEGDYTTRLGLLEEMKTLPFGSLWDGYCDRMGVPLGVEWLGEVKEYERGVLMERR